MDFTFDFIITGTGEAVFLVNKEHKIYDIKGVNSLQKKYERDEKILKELNVARAALYEDATLPTK